MNQNDVPMMPGFEPHYPTAFEIPEDANNPDGKKTTIQYGGLDIMDSVVMAAMASYIPLMAEPADIIDSAWQCGLRYMEMRKDYYAGRLSITPSETEVNDGIIDFIEDDGTV